MTASNLTTWNYPTRIVFGSGAVEGLSAECEALGVTHLLIVTDRGVVRSGIVDVVERVLSNSGIAYTRFDGVSSNPLEAEVEAAAVAYREAGADGVLGVGGGSPMDSAKLVAVRAVTERTFAELDDAIGGDRWIPKQLPPVIAVPTTAGTGSEVGRSSVVTVAATGRKTIVFAPSMMPRVAVLDPALTVGLPAGITAATGFDALTHCLEAYLALGDHPMADGIALAGLELCGRYLPTAVRNGADLDARGAMMKAAMMGAVAFQKGLGACHSLAHPLSSVCALHHGLANALCLPAVVNFNAVVVRERIERVAGALGEPSLACSVLLRRLREEIGLPGSLGEAGVHTDQFPRLADEAVLDACHRSNPRLCAREDFLAMLHASSVTA